METKSSPGEASGYHHHHGIGPVISLFVLFAPSLLRLLSCSNIGGGLRTARSSTSSPAFLFYFFASHTYSTCLFSCCLVPERRVTISKGKKETKKEKTTLTEFVSVFLELHLICCRVLLLMDLEIGLIGDADDADTWLSFDRRFRLHEVHSKV